MPKANTKTSHAARKPRILLLDIETVPGLAYIWSMYDTGVPLERLVAPGRIVCAAYRWYGEKSVAFVSEWDDGQKGMMQKLHAAFSEADAIVTYNGDKFDIPRIRGQFVRNRMKPPPKVPSIDLYKIVKTLGYQSGKLEFVAPYLDIGAKVKHEGFRLWRAVLDGDEKAQGRMKKYNKQDTNLLADLYTLLRPYMTTHPHLHDSHAHSCPVCGSRHLQRRGHRLTRAFRIERLQCQNEKCGAWSDGVRRKIK